MGNLCIIPARGGSKRIAKKNIKEFLGKPIIAYSIEIALKSKLFDEVMVSTDDVEIAEISKEYGAHVPFMRSKKNADDFATLSDVIKEVTCTYSDKFDYGCCILPTAPLLTIKNLHKAYELLRSGFDSVRPVVEFSYPIQRALKFDEEQRLVWVNEEYSKARSQDMQPAFHDAGQFYWFNYNLGLVSSNRGAFVIDQMEVQDIDSATDWAMAELKYGLMDK
jgi:pseudaminic acid cytidylyltransferase